MKKFLIFILAIFFTTTTSGQEWIDDNNFSNIIAGHSGFDDSDIIIVEFWAKFNDSNSFKEWKELNDLDGVAYYRCNIEDAPEAKEQYRVRMVPTILIFSGGDAYLKFKAKAGLDLKCPVDLPKMFKAIEVVKRESQY
tara:strand:+ start:25 stop:438 length:414 start_codon:yes stop_codon:yes gene_type:complete